MGTAVGVAGLPSELFLLIIRLLDPADVVVCRSISKQWCQAFTNPRVLKDVLVQHYSKAREVRILVNAGAPDNSGSWSAIFNKVVARYYALKSGKPRSTTKIPLYGIKLPFYPEDQAPYEFLVCPWARYLGMLKGKGPVPIDYHESGWSYDAGLLVFFDARRDSFVLLDIESNTTAVIPFDLRERFSRRIRLKDNLLAIEWAEKKPLDRQPGVYRHFVTIFDILPVVSFAWLPCWTVVVRSQWRLYDHGFPLTSYDMRSSIHPVTKYMWMSTHTQTHYAAYVWEKNQFAARDYGHTESLFVWDISHPSTSDDVRDILHGSQAHTSPRLLKRLANRELDYLTIRQRNHPCLRRIELDAGMVYIFEEHCDREKGLNTGRQSSLDAELGKYWERVIGIPFNGAGPHWEDKCGLLLPSTSTRQATSPRRATCWRYKSHGIRNQEFDDESAGITFAVEQPAIGLTPVISMTSSSWTTLLDMKSVAWRWTKVYGDERWIVIQSGTELQILHFDWVSRQKGAKC